MLGEDITQIFHNVFESSNPSAPNYFDLQHIGVKQELIIGWYMTNPKSIQRYFKKEKLRELFEEKDADIIYRLL